MAWPAKSLLVLVALPVFTFCAATLYYYHVKEKEWKNYLKEIQRNELLIDVPISSVGCLVGRGGTNLKELQDKTNTKIRFIARDGDDQHRICKIFGTKEDTEAAKALIMDIINPKNKEVLEMLVPEFVSGKLIGRCGDNIRALTRSTNAHISVNRSKVGNKKLVTIKGKPHEIAAAKQFIDNLIKEMTNERTILSTTKSAMSTKMQDEIDEGTIKAPQFERLMATSNDGMIQVYVSSVASPSNFWVQLVTPKAVELDHLVEYMTEYYTKKENQILHKLRKAQKGQYAAGKFDGCWYRVEIFSVELNEKEPDESKVDVFYLDYGDSAFHKLGDLLELKQEFLELKFQAIECSLAGIRSEDEQWSESAIDFFEDLVHSAQWKVMIAEVVTHKAAAQSTHEGLLPHIRLYDPDGVHGVDISKQLIEKGFALAEETDEPVAQEE